MISHLLMTMSDGGRAERRVAGVVVSCRELSRDVLGALGLPLGDVAELLLPASRPTDGVARRGGTHLSDVGRHAAREKGGRVGVRVIS